MTHRDPNANGHFVYSVKSTNIYCRPICPARLARRANIRFYQTPAEAEAAGFRACKRCKPDAEKSEDPQERAVTKACGLIEEALKKDNTKSLRLQDLAKNVGLTPRYFHKIFKDKTGLTPKEYAKLRMAGQNNSDTFLSSTEGETGLDTFNIDNFDFNELVDYNLDSNLSFEDTLASNVPDTMLLTNFGNEIDVNIQLPLWHGVQGPNAMDPGLDIGRGKQDLQARTALGHKSSGSSKGTISPSTFELDAAAILNAKSVPDLLYDFNVEHPQIIV